jgi:hypothetical protein
MFFTGSLIFSFLFMDGNNLFFFLSDGLLFLPSAYHTMHFTHPFFESFCSVIFFCNYWFWSLPLISSLSFSWVVLLSDLNHGFCRSVVPLHNSHCSVQPSVRTHIITADWFLVQPVAEFFCHFNPLTLLFFKFCPSPWPLRHKCIWLQYSQIQNRNCKSSCHDVSTSCVSLGSPISTLALVHCISYTNGQLVQALHYFDDLWHWHCFDVYSVRWLFSSCVENHNSQSIDIAPHPPLSTPMFFFFNSAHHKHLAEELAFLW